MVHLQNRIKEKGISKGEISESVILSKKSALKKSLFEEDGELHKKMDIFIQKRIQELNRGEYHISIPGPARMLIHMISIDFLNSNKSFDLEILFNDFESYLKPINCLIGRKIERNLHGLLISCGPDPYTEAYVGYVQLYRNGMIEAIDSSLLKPTTQLYGIRYTQPAKKIAMWSLEKDLIESCGIYLRALEIIGATLPIFLYISFIHIKDYEISLVPYRSMGTFLFNKYSDPAKKDEIFLTSIKIDSFGINFEEKLKSSFDILWNVFNLPGSRNYDENGKFIYDLFER